MCPYDFLEKKKNFVLILWFQGEASAVPGVARGDELATVIVVYSFLVTWTWPWRKQCFTGLATMASEQWPGHALLCQGWPLESLLVNGFKFGLLPTCYCWLPTPIDWLVDREISVVLQWIWCSTIQCWVVVPLFKLVSYRLRRQSQSTLYCRILWEHAMTTLCQPSSFSVKASPSGCLALSLISAKLEAVWSRHFPPTVWWYQNISWK